MRRLSLFVAAIAVVAIFAFGAVGVTPARAAGIYVVQSGDNLFSIAAKFNVSVSQLATINKIYDVNVLYVGQVLNLPDALPAGAVQTLPGVPQVATTTTSPFGTGGAVVPSTATTATNSATTIFTPTVATFPSGTTVTTITTYSGYIVRPGDTLSSIAQRFNTSPDTIMSANAISNPDLVFVGQLLTIPHTTTNVVQPRVVGVVTPIRSGKVYIVQPGDNLFGIAARTGRDAYSIARANGILDLNSIFVGEPLVIP